MPPVYLGERCYADAMPRIVLDTNVLIASSYSPGSASRKIVEAVMRGEVTMVVSPAVEREYDRLLPRAVRQEGRRQRLFELIATAEVVHPEEVVRVVPEDPEDDKFFAAAVAGAADALVTNDAAVLRVGTYQGVRVMQPAAFVALQWSERMGDGGAEVRA
jgi:uncharacterized protein